MNNYEEIKNMSIDEMADWLDDMSSCSFCAKYLNQTRGGCPEGFCYNERPTRIKQWLQEEV